MVVTHRSRRIASWSIIPLSIAACIVVATIHAGHSVHADQAAPTTVRTIKLGAARPGSLYALSVGVKDPTQLQATTQFTFP